MPQGTCEICGCTETNACEHGCSWVGEDRTHCSQCVCWADLRNPELWEGIFPYDIVPVRTFHPTRGERSGICYPVDTRRLEPEVGQRLAFVIATQRGAVVDDVLASIERGNFFAVGIPAEKIHMVQVARTLEEALTRIEEFRATGSVKIGRKTEIFIPVQSKPGGPLLGH